MANNLFDAYIKGPNDIKQAKIQILIACGLVGFTILITAGMYIFSLASVLEGELGELLDDPTIPITLALMAVFGYFTYKEKIWAAAILLINHLLDTLVLVSGASFSFGALTLIKLVIYICAIRAIIYIHKQSKLKEQQA